jgi:hypothetical protein
MYDPLWVPFGVAAGRKLAMSALPDAPVVTDERRRPRRERRRLRPRAALAHRYAEHRGAA